MNQYSDAWIALRLQSSTIICAGITSVPVYLQDTQDLHCVDTHDTAGALDYLDELLSVGETKTPAAARSRPKPRLPRGALTAQKV